MLGIIKNVWLDVGLTSSFFVCFNHSERKVPCISEVSFSKKSKHCASAFSVILLASVRDRCGL